MSQKIKVLLADDSSVVRRLLKEVLERHDDIEVVGQARHGIEAVGIFHQTNPDVVILDVEMPRMDGVDAAGAIRVLDATVPIIMFSSLTTKGGEATLDALSAGASDYVSKPSGKGHVGNAIKHIQTELIPKIIAWNEKYQTQRTRRKPPVPVINSATNSDGKRSEVLVLGVSTGGPSVLESFLSELPGDFSVPVLIAQHMPPMFTRLLANRLDKKCALHVQEATDATELAAGDVWIAPGNQHMKVVSQSRTKRIILNNDPPENGCRPSVDVLFRSAAQCFGKSTLAVVFTGMGKDGLDGCQHIHDHGGTILVQDEASSVVWGMPGEIAKAGLSDGIMNPCELGREVVRLAGSACMPAI